MSQINSSDLTNKEKIVKEFEKFISDEIEKAKKEFPVSHKKVN